MEHWLGIVAGMGRRIFVLAVCRLHHWDLPITSSPVNSSIWGAAMGGIVAQFIYAGA